jgi:hypothetical protein
LPVLPFRPEASARTRATLPWIWILRPTPFRPVSGHRGRSTRNLRTDQPGRNKPAIGSAGAVRSAKSVVSFPPRRRGSTEVSPSRLAPVSFLGRKPPKPPRLIPACFPTGPFLLHGAFPHPPPNRQSGFALLVSLLLDSHSWFNAVIGVSLRMKSSFASDFSRPPCSSPRAIREIFRRWYRWYRW